MTDRNVERASKLDTATISDALDKLRISGQCLGSSPVITISAWRAEPTPFFMVHWMLKNPAPWVILSTSWMKAPW